MSRKERDSHAEDERAAVIEEMYTPTRNVFPRRRVEIRGLSDLIEADLGDLQKLKKHSKNYAWVLLAVNPYSKHIYTRALKTKKSDEVARNMESILTETKLQFKNALTDCGTEFMGRPFQNLMKKYNINHYQTRSKHKAVHAERALLTLKRHLYKRMDLNGNFDFTSILKEVTDKINSTPHSRLKIIPNKLTKKDISYLNKVYSVPRPISHKSKFKIGQKVRKAENPKLFKRAFYPYFSPQLYTIKKINYKIPQVYVLEDFKGRVLNRAYYAEELRAVRFDDVWLIDRVLKRNKNRCLVRWFGLPKEDDSWVSCGSVAKGEKNKKKNKAMINK